MEEHRVSLLVGRKSYNLVTNLDDDKLREVNELLKEAVALTEPSMEQDERLVIVCMMLASSLVGNTKQLADILDKYGSR